MEKTKKEEKNKGFWATFDEIFKGLLAFIFIIFIGIIEMLIPVALVIAIFRLAFG